LVEASARNEREMQEKLGDAWDTLADGIARTLDASFDSGDIRAHAQRFSRQRFSDERRQFRRPGAASDGPFQNIRRR
jgi:hypothetical protein